MRVPRSALRPLSADLQPEIEAGCIAYVAAAAKVKPALANSLIEMTIPDKLNSRLQKYRLTDKGRQVIALPGGG